MASSTARLFTAKPAEGEAKPTPPTRGSGQRVAAILYALRDLFQIGRALGHLVLELDRGLDGPLVVADELEHLFDRRVARAERDRGALVHFFVLDVHVGDAVVA